MLLSVAGRLCVTQLVNGRVGTRRQTRLRWAWSSADARPEFGRKKVLAPQVVRVGGLQTNSTVLARVQLSPSRAVRAEPTKYALHDL